MSVERTLTEFLGYKTLTNTAILESEFAVNDEIGEFRIVVRNNAEVLFDSYSSFAFSWLGLRLHPEEGDLELLFGTALTGAGYRGIPLQTYLLYQIAMPIHYYYSRLLLSQTGKLLVKDGSQ